MTDRNSSYVQFSPIAYIVKLHIELNNAILISKIVRGPSHRVDNQNEYSTEREGPGTRMSVVPPSSSAQNLHVYFPGKDGKNADVRVESGMENADAKSFVSTSDRYLGNGIQKTVTMFVSENGKEER
jgi:hypothetical protein